MLGLQAGVGLGPTPVARPGRVQALQCLPQLTGWRGLALSRGLAARTADQGRRIAVPSTLASAHDSKDGAASAVDDGLQEARCGDDTGRQLDARSDWPYGLLRTAVRLLGGVAMLLFAGSMLGTRAAHARWGNLYCLRSAAIFLPGGACHWRS
jgi:hypothetical protein